MITDLYYSQLDSTKLEYERLAPTGSDSDSWVIRTGKQSFGQGRGDNLWHSPEGGLWLSFDLQYPQPVHSFPLFVGFCLHRLLTQQFGLNELSMKWPNDLYLGGKKLAGILCNYCRSRYVIGIGINTNVHRDNAMLELDASILQEYIQMPVSNLYMKDLIVHSVKENTLLLDTPQDYIGYCEANLYGIGRVALIESGGKLFRGRIKGLNDAGFLLLRGNDNRVVTISHGSLKIM